MAIIFSCTGGMLGMLAGVTSLLAGGSALQALMLWSGAGIAFTLIGLTLALLPRNVPDEHRQTA